MALTSKILKVEGHGRTFTSDVRDALGVDTSELPDASIDKEMLWFRAEQVLINCVESLEWETWETTSDEFLYLYLATVHYLACQLFDTAYRTELKSEASKDYKYERFPNGIEASRQGVCYGTAFYLEKLGIKTRPALCEIWPGSTFDYQGRNTGVI